MQNPECRQRTARSLYNRSRSVCVLHSAFCILHSALPESPLIHDHHATLYDNLRLQPVPVALERVAIEQDDVGELAGFERAELIAHLNVRGSVRSHDLDHVLHREHEIERLQLVFESGFRVVRGVGAVAEHRARIEDRARVHRHVPGFFAQSHAADDRLRPVLAITEARFVVVGKDAEHRCAETDRRQDLRARSRELLGILDAREVLVRQMHQKRDAGTDSGHHRRCAHGVNLDQHAGLLAFVDDCLQDLHLLRGGAGHGGQRNLAGELDPHRRHLPNLSPGRFGRVLIQPQHARRDDARPIDLARLDAIPQRDVPVGWTARREERGVAGFELRLHLRLFHRAGVEMPMRVDEAWHRAHACGVDRLAARGRRLAGGHRHDLSRADDDRSALDHRRVGADDARVGDREVLRGDRGQRGECETGQKRERASCHGAQSIVCRFGVGEPRGHEDLKPRRTQRSQSQETETTPFLLRGPWRRDHMKKMSVTMGACLVVAMCVAVGAHAQAPAQAPAAAAAPSGIVVAMPNYVSIPLEITVNKPAAEVWKRIGKFCDIGEWFQIPCTITSGKDGEYGAVRSVANEVLVAKTELSYTYTQPVREGRPYNLYHGTLEARPVTATTSKLVYTLVFDNSLLADDAARQADFERRRTQFTQALQNMKILAEGGTLPPAPPRGGRGAAATEVTSLTGR